MDQKLKDYWFITILMTSLFLVLPGIFMFNSYGLEAIIAFGPYAMGFSMAVALSYPN